MPLLMVVALILGVALSLAFVGLARRYPPGRERRVYAVGLVVAALVAAAQALLRRIYKPGFVYHKAGVFLTDIVADAERQQSLMLRLDDERRLRLMEAVDRINRKYGRHTVRPLAMGQGRTWEMKRGRLSGRYTTQLNEVLMVKAC
jgi:DNA polymerase V